MKKIISTQDLMEEVKHNPLLPARIVESEAQADPRLFNIPVVKQLPDPSNYPESSLFNPYGYVQGYEPEQKVNSADQAMADAFFKNCYCR